MFDSSVIASRGCVCVKGRVWDQGFRDTGHRFQELDSSWRSADRTGFCRSTEMQQLCIYTRLSFSHRSDVSISF